MHMSSIPQCSTLEQQCAHLPKYHALWDMGYNRCIVAFVILVYYSYLIIFYRRPLTYFVDIKVFTHIPMAHSKTIASLLPMHWRYKSLAPTHQYAIWVSQDQAFVDMTLRSHLQSFWNAKCTQERGITVVNTSTCIMDPWFAYLTPNPSLSILIGCIYISLQLKPIQSRPSVSLPLSPSTWLDIFTLFSDWWPWHQLFLLFVVGLLDTGCNLVLPGILVWAINNDVCIPRFPKFPFP